MKTWKLISLIIISVILIVGAFYATKFYSDTQVNKELVLKYADVDYELEESDFSASDSLSDEDQSASAARAKQRQRDRRNVRATSTQSAPTTISLVAPTTTPTTTLPTTPTTTRTVTTATTTQTTSVIAPNPVPLPTPTPAVTTPSLQRNINGIAAGYMLSTMTEAQIRAYFVEINKLGLTWVRFDMDWSGIQRNGPDTYGWTEIDRIVRIANEYNINILAILGYAPRWAAKIDCASNQQCAPKDSEVYATFAKAAATRYKNQVSAWQIWNEPNARNFWSPNPSGAEYAEVLKAGYTAIKSVQPNAVVVSGGMSPVTSSANTVSPITFITDIYAAGGKGYFDAVGHHPYTYRLSPASTLPWNHWYQMYKIYDIMNANGDGGKKIWITEIGAPTGGSGVGHELGSLTPFVYGRDYFTENAQAALLSDYINEIQKIRSWVGPVFWYSLVDLDSTSVDPEGHFGLIKSNNQYKSSYNTLLNAR